MALSSYEISRYRKSLHVLIRKIARQAFYCAHTSDLVQGVASEVFRRCGKKGCSCMTDDTKRHGPYFVVQLYENQKQRQVALKNEERHLWQLVKEYQTQINALAKLRKTCTELCNEVNHIIKKRLKKLERK